jgi:glycine cleavage system H protein
MAESHGRSLRLRFRCVAWSADIEFADTQKSAEYADWLLLAKSGRSNPFRLWRSGRSGIRRALETGRQVLSTGTYPHTCIVPPEGGSPPHLLKPRSMPEFLTFMMGQYEARVPTDRLYAKNHLWLKPDGNRYQVGFTAYSVRLLQDVYFLDWTIDADTAVREKQEIGEIESSKALSSLYVPYEGRVIDFNELLLDDPSGINTDGYGQGWLFWYETDATPLTPEEYLKILEDGWEDTQRMIKGQIN